MIDAKIRLERTVNTGNYENYRIAVEDEFDTFDAGLRTLQFRVEKAVKTLDKTWQRTGDSAKK